jgi:hypothetical protein
VILICYDGSDDARAAVEHAGELLRGQPATVLAVRPPFAHILASTTTGLGAMAGLAQMEEIDEVSRRQAVGTEAIVMGSRGLTGLKSLLLGSVSHAVIQHADRTVIVVPSPQVASARAHRRSPRQEV